MGLWEENKKRVRGGEKTGKGLGFGGFEISAVSPLSLPYQHNCPARTCVCVKCTVHALEFLYNESANTQIRGKSRRFGYVCLHS